MNWNFILFNATLSALVILTIASFEENFAMPMSKIITIPIYAFVVAILLEKMRFEIDKKRNSEED